MQVKEQLEAMVKLQNIDLEIDDQNLQLVKLKNEKEKLENELEKLVSKEKELREKIKDKDKQSKILEHKLQNMDYRFEQQQQKMYAVNNVKEMMAVQAEIDNLIEEKKKMEDKVFILLVDLEELNSQLKETVSLNREEVEKINKMIGENEALARKVGSRIEELKIRRAEQIKKLDDKMLKIYQQKRKKAGDRAIVVVTEPICHACNLDIPKSTMNEIRLNNKLTECKNCGTLLFWDGEEE